MTEKIRARIKSIREERNLTQRELANEFQLGESTIRKLENEQGYIPLVPLQTWMRMMAFYGVPTIPVDVERVPSYLLAAQIEEIDTMIEDSLKWLWGLGITPHDIPAQEWNRMCEGWESIERDS